MTETETDFDDLGDASDTHREAVTGLTEDGTLENVGCDDDQLCPGRPLTRWQLAVILLRQLDKNNQPDPDSGDTPDPDSETSPDQPDSGDPGLEGTETGGETDGEDTPDSTDGDDEPGDTPDPDNDDSDDPDGDPDGGDDAGGEAWRAEYLQRLAGLGLTDGCDSGDGCGDVQLTRAQAAYYIVEAFGLTAPGTGVFTDVPQDAAYAAAINALHAAGITNGCSSEPLNFCPDEPITLQQFASLIARTAQHAETTEEPEEAPPEEPPTDQTDTGPVPVFEDIDTAASAHREPLNELTQDGSLDGTGCSDDRLCPRQPINTWQFAVILARRIDNQQTPNTADNDDPDDNTETPGPEDGGTPDSDSEAPDSDDGTPDDTGETPESDSEEAPESDGGTPDENGEAPDSEETPGEDGEATDDWWAPYLRRLAELGVATICDTDTDSDDGGSCITGVLTRAQAARLIAVAYNLPAADSAGFADTADNPHAAAIDALHAAGITYGCNSEPLSFCPDQPLTRQEAATMLTRATRHLNPDPPPQ